MFGPLDEKEATLGDNTPFPTTVAVGETFTTGLLACQKNTYMDQNSWKKEKSTFILI
jgi:hypothetical protein